MDSGNGRTVKLSPEASALFLELMRIRESADGQLRALVLGAGMTGRHTWEVKDGIVELKDAPETAKS